MGFTVLAGDDSFRQGKHDNHSVGLGALQLKAAKGWFKIFTFASQDIAEVKVIEEDEFRSGYATAGWGLVGLAVAGPFGAVIGGVFGGKKDDVIVGVRFMDERKVLLKLTRRQFRKLAKIAQPGRLDGVLDDL